MKTVKLIVYGTLMSGERNHRFCRNAVRITPCSITGTLYDTAWDHIFLPFRAVFPRLHRRPDHDLVVSRMNVLPHPRTV